MPLSEGIFPVFMLFLLTLFAAGVSLDSESERRRASRSLKAPSQPGRPPERQ